MKILHLDIEFQNHPVYTHLFVSQEGGVYSTKLYAKSRWRKLKPLVNKDGYHMIKVNGTQRIGAHRLVIEAWTGSSIPKDKQVNHLNGIKSDNRIENLEVCSQQDNLRHSMANGFHTMPPTPVIGEWVDKPGSGIYYPSQASTPNQPNVNRVLAGRGKTACNMKWRYV